MQITRKGYYTIEYDGELLKKPDGSTRQATTRDDCYEYISEDGRSGIFTIYSPNREVEVPVINVPGVSVNPVKPNVIWETNFAQDEVYFERSTSGFETTNLPNGFTAIKVAQGDEVDQGIYGVAGGGVGGSVAMRFAYPGRLGAAPYAQPTLALLKQFSGSKTVGYSDIYVRYNVKLPDNFKAGDENGGGGSLGHWKFMRLWQNTGLTDDGSWTENREDSHSIVATFNGSLSFGSTVNVTCQANSFYCDEFSRAAGSNGGGRTNSRYFVSGVEGDHDIRDGYFEHVGGADGESGAWELDHSATSTRGDLVKSGQTYHTIEYHIKAATGDETQDLVLEVWFDGVDQGTYVDAQIQTEGPYKRGTVTGYTAANPVVITVNGSVSDVFQSGDKAYITSVKDDQGQAPTGLNGVEHTVTYISDTTFSIPIDGSSFDPFDVGGAVQYLITPSGYGGLFTGHTTKVEGAGTGWNALGVMDNMVNWNDLFDDAGVDGWIDFNDVVVATSRIGHSYVATGDGS